MLQWQEEGMWGKCRTCTAAQRVQIHTESGTSQRGEFQAGWLEEFSHMVSMLKASAGINPSALHPPRAAPVCVHTSTHAPGELWSVTPRPPKGGRWRWHLRWRWSSQGQGPTLFPQPDTEVQMPRLPKAPEKRQNFYISFQQYVCKQD